MPKHIVAWVSAAAMTTMGVLHFARPEQFLRIMPSYLPAPLFLVYASGVAEITLGLGLLPLRTRKLAAWGLVALFIAVFPANINMAINHIPFAPGLPDWVNWARLPFQALFVAVAVWLAR